MTSKHYTVAVAGLGSMSIGMAKSLLKANIETYGYGISNAVEKAYAQLANLKLPCQ